MKQERTTNQFGKTVFRWIATLESGKEIVTYAETQTAALQKVKNTRGEFATKIRPGGNPLTDRPKK